LIVPPPVVVATHAGTGWAAANGASDRAGPGQGAGGFGNGIGGGGNGDEGEGDGTDPEQTHGRLRFGDLPKGLLAPGQKATVGVRYFVEVDGRVRDCRVFQTSGIPALDTITCELIVQRYRFRPARDTAGRPVRAPVDDIGHWSDDTAK
jgi:protein TonB